MSRRASVTSRWSEACRPGSLAIGAAPVGGLMLLLVAGLGCSAEPRALIHVVNPSNGSTAVDLNLQPQMEFHSSVALDVLHRTIVLYDVTKGAKLTVSGEVSLEDDTITYKPKSPLDPDREYRLEVQRAAVLTGDFDENDGSEDPEEAISTWPYLLRLATRSGPRVRGAYLKNESGRSLITVRYSQPMDPVSAGAAVKLLDGVTKAALPAGTPVWLDDRSVQVRAGSALSGASLYILKVDSSALASDNTALDGNDNGKPGEKLDSFCAPFSGLQTVIFSRLGGKPPSACP